MPDVRGFLEAWDEPRHHDNVRSTPLFATPYGNISGTGVLGDYRGPTLSYQHLQFAEAIERGVAQLVILLIERFHWITYTSCEGHSYEPLAVLPIERRVGVLPRSPSEAQTIETTLRKASRYVNGHYRRSPMYIEILPGILQSDDGQYVVIDVFFRRRHFAAWRSYFARLDDVYAGFLIALSQELPRSGDAATLAVGAS
jgi:uncharacterized protein